MRDGVVPTKDFTVYELLRTLLADDWVAKRHSRRYPQRRRDGDDEAADAGSCVLVGFVKLKHGQSVLCFT